MLYSINSNDANYLIRYGIYNRINPSLGVVIVVSAEIVNNQFVIKFREGDTVFDQHVQDIRKGIDWEIFRNILKAYYKLSLLNKIK